MRNVVTLQHGVFNLKQLIDYRNIYSWMRKHLECLLIKAEISNNI